MLNLSDLKPNAGSSRNRMRVGRGQGSGNGCTAGRGNNGHRARNGSSEKFYFEGGQTPLTRRTPKKGFTSPFKVDFQVVNVGQLEALDIQEIDATVLFEHGLINYPDRPVKILGGGTLTKTMTVKADAYSKSAREKLKMPKPTKAGKKSQ